jgi:hypothetical protein
LVRLLSEQKQNIFIWSQTFFPQADRFCVCGPKILGRSKAIWYGLDIVLGKVHVERFFFNPKTNRSKKTFDLVRLLSERMQNTSLPIAYKTKTDNFCQGFIKNTVVI